MILLGIYVYMQFKIPHIGEFYVRSTTDNKFSDEEKQEICNILNINYIEVYKIACEVDFRHEGSYYIFFYSNEKLTTDDIDNSFKLYLLGYENGFYNYTVERLSMNTNLASDYNKISNICKSNYKWWKDNEKILTFIE